MEEPETAEAAPEPEATTSGRKSSRKGSPFAPEVRERIYATERLLPAPLRAALLELLPYGHLPNTVRQVIAQALETRDPAELGERAARRWTAYGYERDHHDGLLRKPLGIVEELLRPTPYCPDPECEDGTSRVTDGPCAACEARVQQRLDARRAGLHVPVQRPPRLYQRAEQCQVCDKPFPDGSEVPADLVCAGCRAELARAAAHINDTPAPEPTPEPDPGHCAAPPSAEYRRYRQEQAAANTPRSAGPPPF
ncbi:hypothetical protein [Streptomyces bacillaris]|uniref:hypothetical protein n=1 Tax=Streptomyces bacillaris TaxID=68179 RepID=UPI00363C6348